jgi:phosphatidylserine decarboxylase
VDVTGGGKVEQVKGVSYSLRAFLGPIKSVDKDKALTPAYPLSLLKDPENNCLYQIVVYLAPGDYHRFHSPTEWKVDLCRHFPGELLSVNPRVAGWIGGLFSLNERAVYVGNWKYGFFSMTAVGATNVGSIRVYSDPELVTNKWKKGVPAMIERPVSVALSRGEDFGEFNLGSTIVLLFEAPKASFILGAKAGDAVKMGQPLFASLSL